MRQLLAIETRFERRKDVHGDGQGAAPTEDSLDVVATRFFKPADLFSRSTIFDHDGADPNVVWRDVHGFEERRAEGKEMRPWAGRPLGENRDRLPAPERPCDCQRLVLGAFSVGTLHVHRAVLVGEPVDEWMAKLVL